MATTTVAIPKTKGGAFLLERSAPEEIFTPEDFTDEHRAIAKTTDEFWQKEVTPHIDEIRHQDHALCARILKKSGELGLTAVVLPEKFGGMEMDLTSMKVPIRHGMAPTLASARCHCYCSERKPKRLNIFRSSRRPK
jgi:alkylation response protein AidB-like acyl-CoA dehydrogenase